MAEQEITVKSGDILGPGGMRVDLTRVTPEQSKLAFERAQREASDPDDRIYLAYKYLSELADTQEQEEEEMAKTSTTSAGARKKITRVKTVAPTLATQKVGADGPIMVDSTRIMERLEELAQRVFAAQPEIVAPPVPAEDLLTREQALDLLVRGFDSLGIPNLGPEPEKPKHKITFDLGEGGKITSHYHWVNQHEHGLFLIYDTRFEYGTSYEPPNLGQNRMIRVSHNSGKEWNVYSLGFVQPLGVFNIINLVIADAPATGDSDLPTTDVSTMLLGGADYGQ